MWQLDWSKLAEVLTYNAKQPMIFSSGLFLFLFLGFSLILYVIAEEGYGTHPVCKRCFLIIFIIRVAVSISFYWESFL